MVTKSTKFLSIMQHKLIKKVLNEGEVRNKYVRYFRTYRRSRDYAGELCDILKELGLQHNVHFVLANDAPRKGWCGRHLKLLDEGRKYFEHLREEAKKQINFEPVDSDSFDRYEKAVTKGMRTLMVCILRARGSA